MIFTSERSLLSTVAALGTMAAAAVALATASPARADASGARRELALSLQLLDQNNATAARSHALKAVAADPGWGLAHAVLARDYLALGEGGAAEAALGRARDAGFDPARAHQLLAHALLLQGQPDRAIAEAKRATPRYAGYAMRVAARALAAQGKLPEAQALLADVLRANDGRSAPAWVDLGRVRQQTGDIGGAIDAATRALAIDRGNVDALLLRGELIRGQFGLVAALPWFETALRVDPWRHDALIAYAATLGDAGRNADMLAATRRALMARPGSAEALYLQAVLAARAENDELARQLLQRTGHALDGKPGPLLLGGILDYAGGGYQQAIDKWRAVLAVQPMNLQARRLLGAALLSGGDARGALQVLRPLALRDDADSYTLSLVGRAFEATGERDWAVRFLDRSAVPAGVSDRPFGTDDSLDDLAAAAFKAPDNPVFVVGHIRGLIDAGRTAAALDEARKVAGRYPGVPQAHILLGDILMLMQRYDDAAAAYRRATDLRFDEPTMLRAVDALDRGGHRTAAQTVLALFLSQNPRNIAAARLTAHWQIAAGDWDDAIATLEGLRARIGNRDAALLAELAQAYAGDGSFEEAQLYAATAYRLAPLNPAIADAYGWVLYQAGADAPALQLMQKAVSIAPWHPQLRWHLAQGYADLGRKAEARAAIAAALGNPGFEDRAAAKALLATLG